MTNPAEINLFEGLVLAGGRGSRVGGIDKGLALISGTSLVESAIEQLSCCPSVFISANRNVDSYKKITNSIQVIEDFRDNFQGPLSGIESAMRICQSQYLCVLPCDTLGLPDNWFETLVGYAVANNSPWVGTLSAGRLHPITGVWSTALLPSLSKYLDAGGRRVMEFVAPYRQHAIVLPAANKLLNLNTAEMISKLDHKND